MRRFKSRVLVSGLLCVAAVAMAQSSRPDGGALIQQLPRPEPLSRPVLPSTPEAAASPARRAGPQVMVRSLRVAGNTLLSQAQLAPVLAPFLQRSLDLSQLEQAAQAVAQRYREEGWVAAAYLPAQDITSGEVLIQVEEARLGSLRLDTAIDLRAPQAQARRYFDALLTPGQPLNADAVERAQLLSAELLGLEVNTRFRKGQAPGATDVEVQLRDKPMLVADLMADNAGARSTGRERLHALMELRNPLSSGDLWSLALMRSEGSESARLGLGLPVGVQGWRVGASALHYSYRLVSPEYAALGARGTVDAFGLEASYPLVRQRRHSLNLLLNADRKAMDNRTFSGTTSRYSSQVGTVGLQARQSDAWLGRGGSSYALLAWSAGRLNLHGSPTQATDAQGARTEGGFNKLRLQLSRAQSLAGAWTLQLSHSQQWARKNLDSSEKFYIGGPDSVRAFPVNEAGGAQGRLSSAELQWALRGDLSLLGFYDLGQVQVNVNDQFLGAAQPNRIRLEGAGLGLQWRPVPGVLLKASWARRLKNNPNPNSTGKDQDGSLLRDRIWLSALYSF